MTDSYKSGPIPEADVAEAIRHLKAKRAASDALQAAQAAERVLPPIDHGDTPASGPTVWYEAFELPHGCVVVEMPSRRVEHVFMNLDSAQAYRDQLTTYLARRPSPDHSYRSYVLPAEPTESGLIQLLDRMYSAEDFADRLTVEVLREMLKRDPTRGETEA